ncbi:TBC1 domain family, partial [Triplophysa rosa]
GQSFLKDLFAVEDRGIRICLMLLTWQDVIWTLIKLVLSRSETYPHQCGL